MHSSKRSWFFSNLWRALHPNRFFGRSDQQSTELIRRARIPLKGILMRILVKLIVALGATMALLFTLVSPAAADGHIRIHLIHGIPGVDVDVEAGGSNVFEDFSFQDTQDLSALAGQTLEEVKVKVAGTDTVAIDAGDVALPAEGNFTVIAHLDADGNPALAVFENDDSATDAGQGRLTVRHAAAAPNVDILANGDVAFENVSNGAGGSLDLGAGTISASVVPTGASEPVVIGPADLPIIEGAHLIVYAVGSLEDDTLTVLTESITGLHSAPSVVDTGNSAVDNGTGLPVAALGLVTAAAAAVVIGRRRLNA